MGAQGASAGALAHLRPSCGGPGKFPVAHGAMQPARRLLLHTACSARAGGPGGRGGGGSSSIAGQAVAERPSRPPPGRASVCQQLLPLSKSFPSSSAVGATRIRPGPGAPSARVSEFSTTFAGRRVASVGGRKYEDAGRGAFEGPLPRQSGRERGGTRWNALGCSG